MKLTDYWSEKAAQNKHYDISGGESNVNGKEVEYKLTPEDVEDFDDVNVKNSFVPESYNRKKRVLKEGEEEQNIAKSKIEAIFRNLSKEDKEEVIKSLSRKEITRDEVLKNFKKK